MENSVNCHGKVMEFLIRFLWQPVIILVLGTGHSISIESILIVISSHLYIDTKGILPSMSTIVNMGDLRFGRLEFCAF